MKKIYVFCAAVLSFHAAFALDGTGSVVSGGLTRTFVFHAPGNAVEAGLPLVIVMHGDGGSGAGIKGYTGFDAVADAEHFIAVYPDALASTWNRYADDQPGDAGLGNPDAPDDVAFISDLISYFCDTHHIDAARVYATGHSAGGFMAYHLAVRLAGRVAAFAPVAASLWGDNAYLGNYLGGNSYIPVPIYHIHGDHDATVDYPDPDHTPVAYDEWPLTAFSPPNCGHTTYQGVTDVAAGVKRLNFCNPAGGKEVTLIRILNGGHEWPSPAGYNPAQAIWQFFKNYSIVPASVCATNSIAETESAELMLMPVPARDHITLLNIQPPFTLYIRDMAGRTVFNAKETQTATLDVSFLHTGLYLLTVKAGDRAQTLRFVKQ